MHGNQSIMPKKRTIVINIVIVILFLFVIYRYREFFENVYESMNTVRMKTIIQISVLSFVYFLLDAYLYHTICKIHNNQLPYMDSVKITFIVAFFRLLTLGSGGMPARVYCYHKKGVEIGDATGAWLIEYLFFKVVILIMGLFSIAVFPNMLSNLPVSFPFVLLGIAIVLLVVVLLSVAALNKRITDFFYSKFNQSKMVHSKAGEKIENLFYQVRLLQAESEHVMREKKRFLVIFGLNLVMVFVYYLIPAILLHDKCGISMWYGSQMMSLSNLLAGAIPTPSGFGSLELVYYSLLSPFDINVEAAGILIILRFFTVILPFFIGAVLWLICGREEKRKKTE